MKSRNRIQENSDLLLAKAADEDDESVPEPVFYALVEGYRDGWDIVYCCDDPEVNLSDYTSVIDELVGGDENNARAVAKIRLRAIQDAYEREKVQFRVDLED